MKKTLLTIITGSVLIHSAFATVTYDNTIAPIVGSGNTSAAWTTATADSGLALSLRAQYNNTPLATSLEPTGLNPDLTPNDHAGTFTFATGTSTLAVWDFWFDVNPGQTSGDTFALTINSSLGGTPVTIPVALIPDNGHSGTEFQNAEDIGFSFLGYNPSLNAVYNFTLNAKDSQGDVVDSVSMAVVNGVAPVPEPTTIIAGALLLLPFGAGFVRKLCKKQTV
jgi:hypothetical protein